MVFRASDKENLEDDLSDLKHHGISRIVSLLEQDEAAELGLASQAQFCESFGIDFDSLPIEDRSTPPDAHAFVARVAKNYDLVIQGAYLLAHCRAGIGRSGMFCSSLLIRHGHSAKEAIELVSIARGFTIPDTQAQIDWLHDHEEYIQRYG